MNREYFLQFSIYLFTIYKKPSMLKKRIDEKLPHKIKAPPIKTNIIAKPI